MNHYDDRASYFALLNDQRQYMKMQAVNQQADVASSAYGGAHTPVVTIAALRTDV